MFAAPFFMQSASGTLSAPIPSNQTLWSKTNSANWGLTPATLAYTSASGNVLLFTGTRNTASTARDSVATWDAGTLTELARVGPNVVGHLVAEVGLRTGGTVGASTLSMVTTPTPEDRNKFVLGWVYDLDQVRGGVGGTVAGAVSVSQGFIEVSLPVSQPGSLLMAAAWCQNKLVRPFVWTVGWTMLDTQAPGFPPEPCGAIASKVSTASGAEVVRMSAGTVTEVSTTWVMVAVELLAG